jgi:squalene synthase HpnC
MENAFAAHLARYGPDAAYHPFTRGRARRYCAELARSHDENFPVVTLLLPRRLHRHFQAVYAYCRWADDLADECGGGCQSLELLRWWRGELDAMYAGRARHPVMVALAETVERFRIPPKPFLDLLFAFEQDQLVKQYTTYEQLRAYCRCSADPVGRLVLYMSNAHTAENVDLSDFICTGLQLANFWQDVSRDLAIGRVYLPEEDRRAFGFPDDDLYARRYTPAFAQLMRFEVERARDLFHLGLPLAERVPDDVRLDVELFAAGGLAILRKIERVRYNVLEVRPELSKWDKGSLLAGAIGRRLWRACAA